MVRIYRHFYCYAFIDIHVFTCPLYPWAFSSRQARTASWVRLRVEVFLVLVDNIFCGLLAVIGNNIIVSGGTWVIGRDDSSSTKNASFVWLAGVGALSYFVVRSVLPVFGFTTKLLSVSLVWCMCGEEIK